jgi:hypothetical protein
MISFQHDPQLATEERARQASDYQRVSGLESQVRILLGVVLPELAGVVVRVEVPLLVYSPEVAAVWEVRLMLPHKK